MCEQCQSVINQGGVLLIGVRDRGGWQGSDDPYRTGQVWGLAKQWRERTGYDGPPVAFIEQKMADELGLSLPQEEDHEDTGPE